MALVSCEADYLDNSHANKKEFFEGNDGLKKYLGRTGEVESFTYNEKGTSILKYKSNAMASENAEKYEIDEKGNITRVLEKPSSLTESYVGCYIKKGSEYAIIYADLVAQAGTKLTWRQSWQNYTIPTLSESQKAEYKTYFVRETMQKDPFGHFPDGKLIVEDLESTGTKDRFLAMALEDLPADKYYFYYNSGWRMNDYSTNTLNGIGKGRQNTLNMIAKWDAAEYGNRLESGTYYDVWKDVKPKTSKEAGEWFLPNYEEMLVFAITFNFGNKNNPNVYLDLGLNKEDYMCSKQSDEGSHRYLDLKDGNVGISTYSIKQGARLSTSF